MISLHRTLTAMRDARKGDDKGFTLIELLVVILIIGVLAAIAIPIFLTQQTQAEQAGYKADLANAKIAYVSYVVSAPPAPASFTPPDAAALTANGYTGSAVIVGTGSTRTSFALCIDKFRITGSGGVNSTAAAAVYTASTCTPA